MLVSVYIRKEDEDLWRELPKKSEAISKMLRAQHDAIVASARYIKATSELTPRLAQVKKVPSPRMSVEEVAEIFTSAPLSNLVTADKLTTKPCPHGANPKFCKHAKNGKPCK
jgi:hypothetical protein